MAQRPTPVDEKRDPKVQPIKPAGRSAQDRKKRAGREGKNPVNIEQAIARHSAGSRDLAPDIGVAAKDITLTQAVDQIIARLAAGTPEDIAATQDIDRIIARLDAGIPEEQKAMDALLSRLRTARIAA